ncbi:hypothetical protein OIC43_03535 [Streptomyces sp. NBC_00825]|uniref:hypothetical protein n=1 Tax=unclassified Streptomyces TaxID=2593676 RepID=UPI002ED41A7B|nr:hypothetical protein OG832_40180 [Streptomyces sp. NBC_00826]WTH88202.1 hypothetical protein OIC43_03535 [Streptomyces sp. NBC_00825]WTH96930.1 hypothetical protein OHA23_03535 [Streptomyces sp. NBC_00822]
MINNPIAEAMALRATASGFDAQRGRLPVPGDPHRSPDSVTIARQISELGKPITESAPGPLPPAGPTLASPDRIARSW